LLAEGGEITLRELRISKGEREADKYKNLKDKGGDG